MGNLDIWNWRSILVHGRHQVPYHVLGVFLSASRTSLTDDVGVNLGHLPLSTVALAVVWEGEPWEHEVDGSEAHVEIGVEFCKAGIELSAHFLAL